MTTRRASANSRSPSGMTTRKATADAKATAKGEGTGRPVPFRALPDAAVFGWGHGLAFFAAEGGAEAGLVDDRSVGAEVIRGVGVGLDALAGNLIP